jgi:hypothetical protein
MDQGWPPNAGNGKNRLIPAYGTAINHNFRV